MPKLGDLMPKDGRPRSRAQTWQTQKFLALALNAAFGGAEQKREGD